jgi:uncharacterized protein involved in exopolysaccharide biosynthesis
MTTSIYKTRIVEPFTKKLKGVIQSLVSQYLELKSAVNDLSRRLSHVYADNERLMDRIAEVKKDNAKLIEAARDYKRIRVELGEKQTNDILNKIKAEEQTRKHPLHSKIAR